MANARPSSLRLPLPSLPTKWLADVSLRIISPSAMLDTFEVLTTSGVVLWSRSYAPVGANVINSLIRDVFIEERIIPQQEDAGSKPTYKKEGYTLKWTASKDLGLIFVVCIFGSSRVGVDMSQFLTQCRQSTKVLYTSRG